MTCKILFRFLIITLLMSAGSVAAQVTDPVVADTLASATREEAKALSVSFDSQSVESKKKSKVISDTTAMTVEPHSPRRATLYSMMLPGLGQIYNRKYWKVPVLYAGIGVLTYMGIQNNSEYKRWHEAYLYTINEETTPTTNELVGKYDATQLKSQSDYYRRNIELTYIFGSFLYILNMVDATVDAHLFNFDISDDLSLQLMMSPMLPETQNQTTAFGMPPVQAFCITWQL